MSARSYRPVKCCAGYSVFGFHFWRALLDGKRWARRQLVEGLVVVAVVLLAGWLVKNYA